MRLTALATSLAVVAGLTVAAPPASAAPPPPDTATASAAEKVQPELQRSFDQDPATDFWIRFDDQADLAPAKDIDDWTERGQFVYDALAETAAASLATVAPELDEAGVEYESFPIANAVLVRQGTESLALDLAANSEVAQVHEAPEVDLIDPVETPVDGPTARQAQDGVEWGLDFINAPEAWDMGATGAGITVSNLDSGVQYDHPALVGQYRGTNADGSFDHDYNWFNTRGSCQDTPCDDNGHGTHTMGTMVGDDGAGNQVGVAPEAQWIATNGCCEDTGFDTLLESGWWILAPTDLNGENPDVSKRPHIVNNSWGSSLEHAYSDFFTAIDAAWTAAGIFSVWSSGNTSPSAACDTVSSPGSHPDAYSVGAFNSDGILAPFSRKGEGEDGVIKPEISAPGVNVRSTWPGNGYNAINGTSMAAPHVSGAVAALWSYDPTLIGQIELTRRMLADSAVDVDDTECGGTADFNNKYGEGRLDLVRLLQLAPREGGTLSGTVTSDGSAVGGAEVSITGPFNRRIGTDADGTFSVHLPAGEYELTTTAFGYLPATTTAVIAVGEDASVDVDLAPAPTHDVTGTVVDPDGAPVEGADISVPRTPLSTVRTDADGAFAIADVPEGDYTLDVRPNACFSPTTAPVTVDAATGPLDLSVDLVVDEWGYTCAVSEGEFRTGTDKLPDTLWNEVQLPFPFALYNGSHDTLNVSRRGVISVDSSTGPGSGGAGIFPFWTQSQLNTSQGGIYTAATTVDGEDAFVIEFRDVLVWGGASRPEFADEPISFSATITRSGKVIMAYGDGVGGDDPLTAGSNATSGIQGWEGQDGIRFSEHDAVFHDGMVVTYEMPDFGYVDTTVVDANDGLPVAGATVAISNADGLVESVTTGSVAAFRRQLHTGDYTMTISAPDYVTETYDFTIEELYAAATVDARLTTGIADLTSEGLDAVLGTDQGGVGTLTLTNTGSAPVTFDLGEVARHPELDTGEVTSSTGTGADRTIDLTAWNEAAAAAGDLESSAADDQSAQLSEAQVRAAEADDRMGTHAGGEVISRITIEGDITEKEPTGLGYDGDVWVHDYQKRINTEYTITGKKTGKEFAAEWNPEYRAFDMAFDTLTGDMCQLEDSPNSFIHCFDTETGEKTREIKGAWSNTQLTGLAYNAARDVFYVGGRGIGSIGTVAGTSHETPGEFLSYCSPPLPEVMGLAYNAASDTIWYSDLAVNRPSRLLQVDPVDCSLVNAWWFPGQLQRQGGGLATDATGALWATDQIADEVLLVDVEDDLITDLPWLSLSTTGGTLAPGESTTVEVSLTTDDVDPGILAANIVVMSDAGRQSKEYVPVTVNTTEYQVGVNAGGAEFTDATGFTWAADQELTDGSWGFHGKSKTVSTGMGIERTDDDVLFQAQRTAQNTALEYVFDDAPAGSYIVDVGFAEIENVAAGHRVVDVLVNGAVTAYAYDAAATVGASTADVRSTVVEHPGGPLTVELRGNRGQRRPSLASLRVTLDPRLAPEGPPEEPAPGEPEEVQEVPAGRTYDVTVTDGLYREGTTKTPWTGNGCGPYYFGNEFLFPFFDTTWDGVCVGTPGMLTFQTSRWNMSNLELPTYGGNDSIYPFWDELTMDDESGLYIGITEVDGLEARVIEYRDFRFRGEPLQRVSFSVTLIADGRIQIGYGDGVGGDDLRTQGSGATIGVESLQGRYVTYSYNEPSLTAGMGLEFTPPQSGTLEGTVTDHNDGEPIAGATVTLTAPDGSTRTATTTAEGRWKAQMVLGTHTVDVSAPGYVTATEPVEFAAAGQADTLDTALTTGIATIDGGDDLDWLLGPDQTASAELTVTNTGSAPLQVSFAEHESGAEAADLPWLTLAGDAVDGTQIAVGDSATITVSVDTSVIEPGLFTGDLVVSTGAGRALEQVVPVRLGSSAFWRGVDVGGSGLTGVDGQIWSADQPFESGTPGAWGHVGGRTQSTDDDIAGTEDDALFSTQRTGKTFSYVFADAPAGTYQIGVGFAEIGNARAGRRSFDVAVGGEAVLYEHDVLAEVDRLTADTHTANVEHPGGDLVVELIGQPGQQDPILNTLTVREDPRSVR